MAERPRRRRPPWPAERVRAQEQMIDLLLARFDDAVTALMVAPRQLAAPQKPLRPLLLAVQRRV